VVANSFRTALAAAWIVVLANGPLIFVTQRLLDRSTAWETVPIRPVIVATALSALVLVSWDHFRSRRVLAPIVAPLPLLAALLLGGWAALSASWSLQPSVSLWRGLVYLALPFVGWGIASIRPNRIIDVLALASGALVSTSLILVIWWPRIGLDKNDDWRGIMTGRNSLGPICGIAVLVGVAALVERRRWAIPLTAAGMVGLAGSGSRTAWGATLVALGLASLLVLARRRHLRNQQRPNLWIWIPATGAGLAAIAFATVQFWDESTFVQRRTIWRLLSDTIESAPLRGVGWEAFWYTSELHTDILLQRGSAHGSIPELLLGLGVVGLALWLVVVVAAMIGVTRRAWQQPDTTAWLWLSLTVLLVVENLTESFVLWFSYNWVLLIAAALRFSSRWPAISGPDDEADSA
jgi:exopolysaccharide production protein ExoQ